MPTEFLEDITGEDRNDVSSILLTSLQKQLKLVLKFLNRVNKQFDEPRNPHQLRVNARKSLAIIDAVHSLVGGRPLQPIKRKLRKTHKVAGPIRDLDVMSENLLRLADQKPDLLDQSLFDALQQQIELSKVEPYKTLKTIALRSRKKSWSDNWSLAIAELKTKNISSSLPEPTDLFHLFLGKSAKVFLTQLDQTTYDIDSLHALRIKGKHLRYQLEMVQPFIPGDTYQQLHVPVFRVHKTLGQMNDYFTLFTFLRGSTAPSSLVEYYRKQVGHQVGEFRNSREQGDFEQYSALLKETFSLE